MRECLARSFKVMTLDQGGQEYCTLSTSGLRRRIDLELVADNFRREAAVVMAALANAVAYRLVTVPGGVHEQDWPMSIEIMRGDSMRAGGLSEEVISERLAGKPESVVATVDLEIVPHEHNGAPCAAIRAAGRSSDPEDMEELARACASSFGLPMERVDERDLETDVSAFELDSMFKDLR